MAKAEIIIARPPELVWTFFTKPENWSKWHEEAVISKVNPGWQKGATIIWGKGSTSNIRALIPGKVVEIESPYIVTAFSFKSLDKESATLLQVDFAPRGGASLSNGGSAHQATVQSQLFRLKQCVENETM